MKVLITEAAYADLAKIGRDIKRDNPARAKTFVDELYDRCQRLFPADREGRSIAGTGT